MQRVPTSTLSDIDSTLGVILLLLWFTLLELVSQSGCGFGVLLGRIGFDFTSLVDCVTWFCSWKLDHVCKLLIMPQIMMIMFGEIIVIML